MTAHRLVSIKIEQAEGEIGKLARATVETVEEANTVLRRIAQTGPDLGYYKTDVWVSWSDGVEVRLRHDVMHYTREDNDTNITRHLNGWARYIKKTAKSFDQPEDAVRLADEILAGTRAIA